MLIDVCRDPVLQRHASLPGAGLGVEQIASRTGMGTATTLRRHFHRHLGVPPEASRRTFRLR